MLQKDTSNHNIKFSDFCTKSIEYMRENNEISIIQISWNNHEIKLCFCSDEKFPHPNINIQHDCTYQPDFLETFPESKVMIKKQSNKILDKLSCENI